MDPVEMKKELMTLAQKFLNIQKSSNGVFHEMTSRRLQIFDHYKQEYEQLWDIVLRWAEMMARNCNGRKYRNYLKMSQKRYYTENINQCRVGCHELIREIDETLKDISYVNNPYKVSTFTSSVVLSSRV